LFFRNMEQGFTWDIGQEVEISTTGEETEEQGMQEAVLASGQIRIPFGLRATDVEPIKEVLDKYPNLQRAMQSITTSTLGKNTMGSYESAVNKFKNFCTEHKYRSDQVTESMLIHYIAWLHDTKATLATISQVKPAIQLMLELQTGKADAITARVQRFLIGAKRQAAEDRLPVRKAPEVSLQLLQKLTETYLLPYQENIYKAPIFRLRTVVRLKVEYYTFCRLADYVKLQACHVERRGEDLEILFPTSKNDQYHNGQRTVVAANRSPTCPVRAIKLYFQRLGFRFGADGGDKRHLHCRIRKFQGRWFAYTHAASLSKAREELKDTLAEIGGAPERTTDKSFKMLGVTQTLSAGVPVEDVARHGRWRTPEMPLRYQHNSFEDRRQTAIKIPGQHITP
jgi:hypothetical protein